MPVCTLSSKCASVQKVAVSVSLWFLTCEDKHHCQGTTAKEREREREEMEEKHVRQPLTDSDGRADDTREEEEEDEDTGEREAAERERTLREDRKEILVEPPEGRYKDRNMQNIYKNNRRTRLRHRTHVSDLHSELLDVFQRHRTP